MVLERDQGRGLSPFWGGTESISIAIDTVTTVLDPLKTTAENWGPYLAHKIPDLGKENPIAIEFLISTGSYFAGKKALEYRLGIAIGYDLVKKEYRQGHNGVGLPELEEKYIQALADANLSRVGNAYGLNEHDLYRGFLEEDGTKKSLFAMLEPKAYGALAEEVPRIYELGNTLFFDNPILSGISSTYFLFKDGLVSEANLEKQSPVFGKKS